MRPGSSRRSIPTTASACACTTACGPRFAGPPAANVVSLGRTVGLRANGAISNVALSPAVVGMLRRELREGDYDVVHIHEPIVPLSSWSR